MIRGAGDHRRNKEQSESRLNPIAQSTRNSDRHPQARASLAPDIVEAIVRGDEPSGLSLERLVKRMPVVWAEQRKWMGFAER